MPNLTDFIETASHRYHKRRIYFVQKYFSKRRNIFFTKKLYLSLIFFHTTSFILTIAVYCAKMMIVFKIPDISTQVQGSVRFGSSLFHNSNSLRFVIRIEFSLLWKIFYLFDWIRRRAEEEDFDVTRGKTGGEHKRPTQPCCFCMLSGSLLLLSDLCSICTYSEETSKS